MTDFDAVFLCPPRLLDQYETSTYEEKLRTDLYNEMDIDDENILGVKRGDITWNVTDK